MRWLPWIALATFAAHVDAQGIGAGTLSGYRLELGVTASTPIVEDGNGVAVRRGLGPILAGDALWIAGERTRIVGSLRASVAPLKLRSLEQRWSGGSAWQLDFVLRAEHAVAKTVSLGAGLGASLIRGPDDLIPFQGGRGYIYGWGPELIIAFPFSRERRTDVVIGGDAVRISPRSRDAHLVGGWIGRARLGVRRVL